MAASREPTREEMLSLHRYFIAETLQKDHFYELITKHADAHGKPPTYAGEDWNESWIAMSYWYGGLYVVIEG